VYNQTKAIQLI